jgi:Spy/CpxP family protein refolding chaperone
MNTTKRKLIALTGAIALSLVAWSAVNAQDPTGADGQGKHGRREWRQRGMMLDRLSENLNLTADQKAKVQPIVEQARPQIRAIHQEAMQKTKAVMDNTMTQIRPLLTPEQQQKLDAMQKAHEDMRDARQERREARGG